MQVLSYCDETSEETDTDTDEKWYRNQIVEHCLNRKEIEQGAEHRKSRYNVGYNMSVYEINDDQGNCGADKTDKNTLNNERRSYEKVCGTNILHDVYLVFSDGNTHSYRIADKEYGYQQKNKDNTGRYISYKQVEST